MTNRVFLGQMIHYIADQRLSSDEVWAVNAFDISWKGGVVDPLNELEEIVIVVSVSAKWKLHTTDIQFRSWLIFIHLTEISVCFT